jgi:ABC-type uncharacterized transport system fused permease/ATPase subunit
MSNLTDRTTQRAERMRLDREARAKAMKKRQRQAALEKVGTFVVGAIGVVIAAAILIIAIGVIFQLLVWNLGVVGLVAACGGTVGKISLTTAIGAVLLGSWIGQILSGDPLVSTNFKRE